MVGASSAHPDQELKTTLNKTVPKENDFMKCPCTEEVCDFCSDSESIETPFIPDEYELIDTLAVMLGISAAESQEERCFDLVYHNKVLRTAIKKLQECWDK